MKPNFLLIGAQKAATTWLAKCIGDHPDIFMSDPKELYFFNHRFHLGVEWYERYFDDYAGARIVGEATPGYLTHNETALRIHDTLGTAVSFVASLRHPVERAYSAFWMYVRSGAIPLNSTFEEALDRNDRFGLKHRGFYYKGLRRYFELFPRERFLILIYEELRKEKKNALNDCYSFLGVDPDFESDHLDKKLNKSADIKSHFNVLNDVRKKITRISGLLPSSVGERVLSIGRKVLHQFILKYLPTTAVYKELPSGLRDELLGLYMDDIKRLETLLNRDLTVWYGK